MNDKPLLFSIIIPAYNRAAFLPVAIQSVLNQNYEKWELIIVNDGSTDDTEKVLQSYNDSRIKHITIVNSERGAARNRGIALATGNFISFLDSDDQLLPNHFEEAATFIRKNENANVFHLGYKIVKENGIMSFASHKLSLHLNFELKQNNVISPNGIFLKAEVAKQNLFSEDRILAGTEDYELWLRLATQFTIFHHPVITSMLIDHPQRSMNENDFQKIEKRILLFLEYVNLNSEVRSWMGNRLNRFVSYRFSYLSLHAALVNNKKAAYAYLWKALKKYPLLIFSKRFAVILKRIFNSG